MAARTLTAVRTIRRFVHVVGQLQFLRIFVFCLVNFLLLVYAALDQHVVDVRFQIGAHHNDAPRPTERFEKLPSLCLPPNSPQSAQRRALVGAAAGDHRSAVEKSPQNQVEWHQDHFVFVTKRRNERQRGSIVNKKTREPTVHKHSTSTNPQY